MHPWYGNATREKVTKGGYLRWVQQITLSIYDTHNVGKMVVQVCSVHKPQRVVCGNKYITVIRLWYRHSTEKDCRGM